MSRCRLPLLTALLAGLLSAQEYRGTILGRIIDPSDAPVLGASIEVLNVDTGVVTRARSNEAGNYQVPFLVPGNYSIKVNQAGFKAIERTGIRVATNASVTLDFTLVLGATSETVTVTDAPPLLNTATAELGQVIDKTFINQVSVSLSRNVLYNVRLAAGITGGGGSATGNGAGAFSVSGSGGTSGRIEYLIDGIPNTVAQNNGGVVYIPSMDAVEEVKVHTTMFDAQYGHSNGGAINLTTKSGTNQLHGTVYLFKRWAALDANSWTNNRSGIPKAPTSYKQYGYLVSGPVYLPKIYDGRNRTFFSTTLENDNDPRELTRQARVPTSLERQADFSQTLNRRGGAFAIYDPLTTVGTGTNATRQPFAGARIPSARLNPTGAAWMKLFPEANIAGVPPQLELYNWIKSGVYTVEQKQISFRVDHNLSEKQRMFVRYGRLLRDQIGEMLIPGQSSFPVSGGSDLEHLVRRFHNFGFDDTIVFSPSLVASFRYGLVRKVDTSERGALGYDIAPLSLPSIWAGNQAVSGWPTFDLGGNIPTLGTDLSFNANDQHTVIAAFTKLSGRHSIKWGSDWRVLRWNRNSPGSAAPGSFAFNSGFTQANPFVPTSADVSGSGMASLLLGYAASGSLGYNSALSLQNHYLGLYVQDDWKLNQKLTLNFGMRWELETPYTERYNRMSYSFDESAALPSQPAGMMLRGGILFAGVNGNPRRGGIVDGNNYGPRFGFAYSLRPKTVVRGGYGIFFSGQAFNTGFLADVGVFNANTPYVATIDNGGTPYATLSNPFPAGLRQPIGASAGLMAQTGDSVSFFDLKRVSPYNQQWQFSIQHELPSQILLETAYVGMHSLKQFESFNMNEKPDVYNALGTQENTRVPNPFLNVLPPTSTLGQGTTITQNRLWVRFPQFTSSTAQGANTGRSIYHGLQLRADKRLTNGLSVLWTYTFSKLFDNETTSLINERHYRAVSGNDQSHVMRLAATYLLPWRFTGSGVGNMLLRQLAQGWLTTGYLVAESGTPMSVTHANGRPLRLYNSAKSGDVGERLGDQWDPKTGVVLNPYFQINAFQPLASQYVVTPEAPRLHELRRPGTFSINLSLSKDFLITERIRLQIRMESTGLTNTPNFAAPGTNMNSLATYGIITSASGSRSLQGSARVSF